HLRGTQTDFVLRRPQTLIPSSAFQTFLFTAMNIYDSRGRIVVGARYGLRSEKDFEAWFTARIDLFMETTVKAVRSMSVLPEVWMIFIDEEMRDFAAQMERRIAHLPHAVLCPVPRSDPKHSGYYSCRTPLAEHVAKRLRGDARYVMTMMLDNDDCLHRD